MNTKAYVYISLALLTGLNLCNYLDRYVLASIVPPLKAELSLTDAEAGWLSTAFMIGYFVSAPVFGYLGDRERRKILILAGIVFWCAGTVLSGFCNSYRMLMACRILVGFGEASFAVLAPAWIADLFPAGRRNNILTLFYAAAPAGAALGYLTGGFALNHGGWRFGFFFAGVPGLMLALALAALREPPRWQCGSEPLHSKASNSNQSLAAFISLFRIVDYTLTVLGLTAYTFALGAFAAWGPTFLNRVHALELGSADKIFGTALIIGGLLGTFCGGFTATAWQKKTPAGYPLLLTLSAVLTVLFAAAAFSSSNLTTAITCLCLAIFLAFLPTGPISTLLIETVPAAVRARAIAAAIFTIHFFGDFWSPAFIGALADRWADPRAPGAGLQSAIMLLPAVFSFAAFFWGWLALRQRKLATRS